MPSVTLTAPVNHDGEDLVAGDIIPNLSDKEAARLVGLGFAELGEVVVRNDGNPDIDEVPAGISEEEIAEIKAMKKSDVMVLLEEAGVEFKKTETLPVLQQKLMAAWAGRDEGDPGAEGAGE